MNKKKIIEDMKKLNGNLSSEQAELLLRAFISSAEIESLEDRLKDAARQVDVFETRFEKLEDITKTQCTSGNYDANEYMRGMANGLILAVSIMGDTDPRFFDAPGEAKAAVVA